MADKVVLECCMAALCAYYRAQKLGGIAMEVLEFHFQQNYTVYQVQQQHGGGGMGPEWRKCQRLSLGKRFSEDDFLILRLWTRYEVHQLTR